MCIYVRQGLIWLLIATIVEVPPVVRLVILWDHSFAHHCFTSQVFILLNLNGKFLPPRIERQVLIELYSNKTTSAPQPGKFLVTDNNGLYYQFLTPFYNTDIPKSLGDGSDHCCNRDVSLSCKL